MGGTHIDAVIIENGRITKIVKNPANREDLFGTIWTALEELLVGTDKNKVKKINLSTTISTNAIVEGKTAPVGMMIQSGPGLPRKFLDCSGEKVFISGYIDHRGTVARDLELREIKQGMDLFRQKGMKACAVVTKFSTRNPTHELRIKKLLKKEFGPITLGHSLSGKLNFPRRVFTSYLNAAVADTFQDFATNLKKALEKEGITAPLFILKADGGTMNIKTAEEKPVETILSGPAASFAGLNAMLSTNKDALLLDIGGTTTDIFFLADGVPLFEPLGIEIDIYKTLVRSIYSASIGLGGDSKIKIENGKIKIGPTRAGNPYAFGGPQPTPTDAMIVSGLMEKGDRDRALAVMADLGQELGLTAEEIAQQILAKMGDTLKNKVEELLQTINGKPVYTVKELLAGKEIKPQLINIIGGPAKAMITILAERFNLPCYCPENYQIANAIGAALAKTTTEITMQVDTAQGTLSVPELQIHEKISKKFTLTMAKKRALALLKQRAIDFGAEATEVEGEIIEESCFNIVRGFSGNGQNIRLKVQVKPGISISGGGVEDY